MYGPVCNEIIVLLMDWLCASTEMEISLQQNQNGFQQATRSCCTLVAVSCTALASLNRGCASTSSHHSNHCYAAILIGNIDRF